MSERKKTPDPLAERCHGIIKGELKALEDKVIDKAVELVNAEEPLDPQKAVQMWTEIASLRGLDTSMEKHVKRHARAEASRAKEQKDA